MPRLVHRVGSMIGCVFSGRALLIKPSDFSSLVDQLPLQWNPLDSFAFKLAVLNNMAIGRARKMYRSWERQFIDQLEKAIGTGAFDPYYTFEAADAQRHLDDYLEAFRSSFRYINFATAPMHDGRDILYNVSIRAKQSPLDWLLHRYGRTIDEWNFLQSEVERICGSSLNFVVTIGGLGYAFSPNGVCRSP